jgi:hypothetical protein
MREVESKGPSSTTNARGTYNVYMPKLFEANEVGMNEARWNYD